jgi:hypothetical protein
MSARVPMHARTAPAARPSEPTAMAAGPPLPAVLTLGVAALWMVLVVGLELAIHSLGMTTTEAWAYAIGMVSYIYLFVGVVLGLVYVLKREQWHGRSERDVAAPAGEGEEEAP